MKPSADDKSLVLILSPLRKDRDLSRKILGKAGFRCRAFASPEALVAALEETGGGMLILAAEALYSKDAIDTLTDCLHHQPPWSDLPVSILINSHISNPQELKVVRELEQLHSATFLHRPVSIASLVSMVRAGLLARSRQYQVRDLLLASEREVRQRDEFLAMLSHELRNPLSAISSAVQAMALDSEQSENAIPILKRQVKQLERMVNDLLDVARITSGKVELQKEPVNITEIINSALEAVNNMFLKKDIRLRVSLPEAPTLIKADFNRMIQVCTNLLHNAAKFTPPRGLVQVTLIKQTEGTLALTVQDNGIGMDKETQALIFDLFSQGRCELDRSQGGLGIGLTVARSIVEMHGGVITVESPGTGQGARFTIELPVYDGEQAQNAPAFDKHSHGGLCRILLVDDNKAAADATAMLLEAMGHEVRLLYQGDEVLKCAREFQPEAVFLDLGMPNMNGFEVAEALQTLPNRRTMVVVALTGYGDEDTIKRARAAGFDHHLLKPANLESIQELLLGSGLSCMQPAQGVVDVSGARM